MPGTNDWLDDDSLWAANNDWLDDPTSWTPGLRPERPGFFEAIGAKAKAGWAKGRALTNEALDDVLPDLADEHSRAVREQSARGVGFEDAAAQDQTQKAIRIAQGERRYQALDKNTPEMEAGMQEIGQAEGFVDSAKAIIRNPQAVAGVVAESAGMMAPGMAAAVAGGPVGVAAVGAQSGAIEYESTILETMAQAGVDTTDPTAVRQALDDPELMAEAKRRGTARAIPIALFDAATAGIAGRLVAGARGTTSAITRTGGELGVQATGGMAGESVGQLASEGRIDSPSDILMEGIAELPTGVPEAAGNYSRAKEASRQNRTREQVQADYNELAEQFGTVITSMERGVIARGAGARSQHPKGTAADFRSRHLSEEQAQALMDAGRARGYEVIDERNTDQPHIHMELPPGGRVSKTGHSYARSEEDQPSSSNVAERRRQRWADVEAGNKPAGAAVFEDAMDEARDRRGVAMDRDQRTSEAIAAHPTPEPTKVAKPPVELPGLSVQELLEQHRSALADANDKTRSPQDRRAAKKRAQYLMTEVEAANSRPASTQIEQVKDSLLDQAAAQGMSQAGTTYAPQPQGVEVTPPETAQVAPQPTAVAQPADVPAQAPVPAVAPQAKEPEVLPAVPQRGVWQEVGEARTPASEAIRYGLNRDPGLLSMARTEPSARTMAAPVELGENEVVEVRLSPEQTANLDRLGKLLGRRIIPYKLNTVGSDNIVGIAGDAKHIFINVSAAQRSDMSVVGLIGHEFTHTLRKQGSAQMEALIRFAKGKIDTNNSYIQKNWAAYTTAYAGRGYSNAKMVDVFTEEMVADLIGDLIMDEQFWAELAQDNPSLFRQTLKRLISFLRGLADRAKKLGDEGAFRDIEQVRARAAMMLSTYIKDNKQDGGFGAPEIGQPMAKLDEKAPANVKDAAQLAREVRIERGTQLSHAMFEQKDYMGAAREAAKVSDEYAPPMPIDTPEKKAFFKDASPDVKQGDKAAVFVHGTARDITVPKPKQGDATFLAQDTRFPGPYAAASQSWVNTHGKGDILVDGQSMRELREMHKQGSAERTFAELMITHEGDIDAAREALPNYAYVSSESLGGDIDYLDSATEDAVREKLDQVEFLLGEDPSFVSKGEDQINSGMNYMPYVTNVKKPWDFANKRHVKLLLEELHDKFGLPSKMSAVTRQAGHYKDWDSVGRALERGSWTLLEDKGIGVPQLIRELGFDAYYVQEEGYKNLAVFDAKNLKSAYGNAGPFGTRKPTAAEAASLGMTLEEAVAAQEAGDIRLRLGNVLSQTFSNGLWNDNTRTQLERWFLDEFRDVREVQKIIGRQTFGGRVPPNMDVHRNENLRHGAYQDARSRAEERFIKPIAKALSRADVSMEEFSRYLWWRHAGERDNYLRRKMDPQLAQNVAPDALAGIDPAEAARNIAALDPRKRAAFERAAKFIDGMRHFTLDALLRSGQITQDYYNAVLAQYQHYVPLRGMPDGSDVLNGSGKSGKGLSMNDKGLGPRAKGRKSEPQNIIEEMMRDMDSALVGTQKQRVLESLARLIAAHPDPDLWEIQPVAAERKWVNGVLTVVQTNGEAKDQITFMHRGIPVKIEIRHEGMRKAMLNLQEPLPKLLRTVGRITRFLSAVKTSFSPFFLLVNPVRDAGLAIMGVGAEHGMGALRDMARFMPHTYEVLAKDQNRKIAPITSGRAAATRGLLQQYAREFAAVGGKTGYTYVSDIREQQHKLQHLMDRHAKSKGMKDIMAGNFRSKDAGLLMRKSFQHVAHLFETLNDLSENSTRLAVYAAMREKGMSVEDAASYAKEVTVNFNRRGSLSKVLNGFYMFFNAAMQGSARLVRLMKNRKFQAMMGSIFAASYSAALAQMFAAGDDDDGESKYDKAISDAQAQRSIGIYLGDGKSFAIPVPYGPNIFSYMGYRMAKLTYDQARGKRPSYGKAAGDIAAQALTSMSPIDPGKGLQAFLPEFVRIFANAQTNTNDFGGKLSYKVDPFDSTKNPKYHDGDVRTGAPYHWLAQGLNATSGGTAYRGGFVNWTPEQTRYAVEQITGGMGRLATESWELTENLLAGIDPEPSDIPLLNVYLRGHGSAQVNGTYFDNLEDYENTVADWKLAIANNDEAKLEEIVKRAPWIEGAEADASTKEGRDIQAGSVMEGKRQIDREMRSLKKERDGILADESLSWRERKRLAHEIDLEIDELKKDFNYTLNSGRGYPATQGQQ